MHGSGKHHIDIIVVDTGVKQGCNMSNLLFEITIDWITKNGT